MLVIIAGLLLLNCFNNGSGIFPPTKASVPSFVEDGKYYSCVISDLGTPMAPKGTQEFKIESIDKESGWVKAQYWIQSEKKWGVSY